MLHYTESGAGIHPKRLSPWLKSILCGPSPSGPSAGTGERYTSPEGSCNKSVHMAALHSKIPRNVLFLLEVCARFEVLVSSDSLP